LPAGSFLHLPDAMTQQGKKVKRSDKLLKK